MVTTGALLHRDPAGRYTVVVMTSNLGSDAIQDLTKNQNRFDLPIMDKKWSWDSAWDVYAMSNYNTITSISESPKKEGLIYIGTREVIPFIFAVSKVPPLLK